MAMDRETPREERRITVVGGKQRKVGRDCIVYTHNNQIAWSTCIKNIKEHF